MEDFLLATHGWQVSEEQKQHLSQLECRVEVVELPSGWSLGRCLRFLSQMSSGDAIFRFDDDDYYGPNYLLDQVALLQTTGSGIVGKVSYPIYFERVDRAVLRRPGQEFRALLLESGATLGYRREVAEQIAWPNMTNGEDTEFLVRALLAGVPQVCGDRWNFCCLRGDLSQHTWKTSLPELARVYPTIPEGFIPSSCER